MQNESESQDFYKRGIEVIKKYLSAVVKQNAIENDSANFSEQFYKNYDMFLKLKEFNLKLSQSLIEYDLEIKSCAILCVMTGQGNYKVASQFKSLYNINENIEIVARPFCLAINFIYNQLTLNSYKSMNVSCYTFLGTLDSRTCAICGTLDGKHFKVEKADVGKTYPPLCDHCRCTTVAYYPNDNFSGTRIARNPETGKNYKVDRNMTYEEWRKEMEDLYPNINWSDK